MFSALGTDRILQELQYILGNSSRIQKGLRRNRPERNPEFGSSIPTGFFPYPEPSTSNSFPPPVSSGNFTISHRKRIGYLSCVAGADRKYHRIPYTTYKHRFF